MSDDHPPPLLFGWRPLLAGVVLVVAMAAVYGRVSGFSFPVWDDEQHIVDNPHLNPVTWHGVWQLWRRSYWGLYIPLSYTLFAAEASICRVPLPDGGWGPNPLVFHLGNLVLHVGCVLMVLVILRRLCRHEGAALAGALLFGLHPLQVESVAWISESRGLLCAVFALVATWQYVRCGGVVSYGVATACFILALLCKPAAVAVPLVVAVLDVGVLRQPWRRAALRVGLWTLLAAAWIVFTKTLQPDERLPFVAPLWARPLVAGDALAFYLVKLVAPLGLGPDYGRDPQWVMGQPWFHAAWLLPAGVLAVLVSLPNRRNWLTAAGVFVAWLLPVLGLVPFVFQRISTVADRYTYLAMLGPALALGWLLARYWNRWTVAAATTVVCLLGVLSFIQSGYWRDDATLMERALVVNPRSLVGTHNRGLLLARQGKPDAAMALYREAIAEHPRNVEPYLSMAAVLIARNRVTEAVRVLREAERQVPPDSLLYCELGTALGNQGAFAEAVDCLQRALEINPRSVRTHLAWGKLLMERGAPAEASEQFRAILEIDPRDVPAHVNLGVALQALGKADEARYHYEKALEVSPDSPSTHYNLANLLAAVRDYDGAVEHYRAALEYDPHHAHAHVNLGMALLAQGHAAEAIEHYRAALQIDPRLFEARANLGQALAAVGQDAEAAAEFRRALELVPPDSSRAEEIRQLLKSIEK